MTAPLVPGTSDVTVCTLRAASFAIIHGKNQTVFILRMRMRGRSAHQALQLHAHAYPRRRRDGALQTRRHMHAMQLQQLPWHHGAARELGEHVHASMECTRPHARGLVASLQLYS